MQFDNFPLFILLTINSVELTIQMAQELATIVCFIINVARIYCGHIGTILRGCPIPKIYAKSLQKKSAGVLDFCPCLSLSVPCQFLFCQYLYGITISSTSSIIIKTRIK